MRAPGPLARAAAVAALVLAADQITKALVRGSLGFDQTRHLLPGVTLVREQNSGVAPAYVALIAEAWVDAAVAQGIPAAQAAELVGASLAGAAALLQAREMDTLAVRREVTSPGGMTARGLRALEQAGLRSAFANAALAVASGQSSK